MKYFPYLVNAAGVTRPLLLAGSVKPWHGANVLQALIMATVYAEDDDLAFVVEEAIDEKGISHVVRWTAVRRVTAENPTPKTITKLVKAGAPPPSQDEEIWEFFAHFLGKETMNDRERRWRELLRSKSGRLTLIAEVTTKVYDETHSWEVNTLGSDLAYLVMAIATGEPNSYVQWEDKVMTEETTYVTRKLFERLFEPDHNVWLFIRPLE